MPLTRPKSRTPSTLLAKSAATALCTKARQLTLRAAAPCLLANKWLVQAGALLTLKKPNLSLKQQLLGQGRSSEASQKSQQLLAFFISSCQSALLLGWRSRQGARL
jgi:hypothetical protein